MAGKGVARARPGAKGRTNKGDRGLRGRLRCGEKG